MFQVMPPQGGIEIHDLKLANIGSFKSCPRKGASFLPLANLIGQIVSSHAPARGHPQKERIKQMRGWFQVMPPQGGIDKLDADAKERAKFQVMPPQGGIENA